jgi:hypothetical protein
MLEESRFDPNAVSWVGARGLMQVMPRTGRELGLEPLDDPEVSVLAGIRYMDWLRDRFPERLPVDERMWFSLASYNAGLGHVRDARRLADDVVAPLWDRNLHLQVGRFVELRTPPGSSPGPPGEPGIVRAQQPSLHELVEMEGRELSRDSHVPGGLVARNRPRRPPDKQVHTPAKPLFQGADGICSLP